MKQVVLFIFISLLAIAVTDIMDWLMGWRTESMFTFVLVVMIYLDIVKEDKQRWE